MFREGQVAVWKGPKVEVNWEGIILELGGESVILKAEDAKHLEGMLRMARETWLRFFSGEPKS